MFGSWFHRNINGIQAEQLLKEHGLDGSFLIRPSNTTSNSYTLSVKSGKIVKHIKIQNNPDCGYEIGEGGDKFATLAELVDYFVHKEVLRDKSDGSMIVLKYPLNSKDPTNERYFHGSISGPEATNLLLAKGKKGTYLVRESQSNPNYVLCVVCENVETKALSVIHLTITCTSSGYTMQNLNKHFNTLDELIQECIRMSPLVDVKDNVVYLIKQLSCSRVNALNFEARCNELESPTRNGGNGFSEEFNSLQQGQFLHERKIGSLRENISKNRFKTILPFDYNRIVLLDRKNTPNDPNDSDYINANRIEGEKDIVKNYLATQGPLPNTICDFWTMVWQEDSHIILMITNEEEKGKPKCSKYWPDPNDKDKAVIQCDNLSVRFVRVVKKCADYLIRELVLANKAKNKERTIYQFQFLTWSDHSVPEDVQIVIDFIQDFNEFYKKYSYSKPITIHCSAGIGRTGAIIVIDMIIDKINKYGAQCKIDIFKTVCDLRSQRSGMIQTEKQYQFVYNAIKHYIQNFLHSTLNTINN